MRKGLLINFLSKPTYSPGKRGTLRMHVIILFQAGYANFDRSHDIISPRPFPYPPHPLQCFALSSVYGYIDCIMSSEAAFCSLYIARLPSLLRYICLTQSVPPAAPHVGRSRMSTDISNFYHPIAWPAFLAAHCMKCFSLMFAPVRIPSDAVFHASKIVIFRFIFVLGIVHGFVKAPPNCAR